VFWRFANGYKARKALLEEDLIFEAEYAAYHDPAASKPIDVGRPFLLTPLFRIRGGIVLVHGYMAAPLEVRNMAEYLCRKGYAVYAVRLRGHGTSPVDLAARTWQEWCASIESGCAIVRTLTDNLIVGGFSLGAGLALLTAGTKRREIRAAFAIDAPLHLRSSAARLAPSIVKVNALLKHLPWKRLRWEYVENDPENRHINYFSNPVAGMAQLEEAMRRMFDVLKDITAPTLILQGSRDPVVHFDSAASIFEKVGASDKVLTVIERDRHGIINGPGSEDVFDHVHHFLTWAGTRQTLPQKQDAIQGP
jgi:esterase/lipase